MKTIIILSLALFFSILVTNAQTRYFTKTGTISFFSHTPMEDINAENHQVTSFLDIDSGEMVFAVLIRSFEFKKSLMEEHFNENYMDSEKFPKSQFKGIIVNISSIDFSKPGEHEIQVKGDLTIRGETQPVETSGTLEIKENGKINGISKFNIDIDAYGIKIPKLVKDKIAKSIEISCDMNYELYNK